MLDIFRRMWLGWNAAVRGIVTAQSRALMLVAWLLGLAPVALVLRLAGRRLLDRAPADPAARTHRITREPRPLDMERASRMF